MWGWGFSSVVQHLPSKCKALGLVLSWGARGGDDVCFLDPLGSVGTSDLVPCKRLLISVSHSFPSGYFLCCSITTEQSFLLGKDRDTDNQYHKDRHRFRDRQIWTHTTETEHTVNMKQRFKSELALVYMIPRGSAFISILNEILMHYC